MIAAMGCTQEVETADELVFTGDEAEKHLSLCRVEELPRMRNDLWVYDGGTFNGMIYYVSFQCESLEDCWSALKAFQAPDRSEFHEGVATKFAVNQQGPSFYDNSLSHPQWNISKISDGVSHEWSRDDRAMNFWAIDRERLRIYFHHESGGFPTDAPNETEKR